MGLTEKDKEFLEELARLMESRDLSVELQAGMPSYMILRGTYGQKVAKAFRVTRQGVRWRFHHVFNKIYVEAFETVLMIEKTFGTRLRDFAICISRERHAARRKAMEGRMDSPTVHGAQEPTDPPGGARR